MHSCPKLEILFILTNNTYKNYKNVDINKSLQGYIIIKALIDAEMAIQLYFLSLHNYMTSRNLLQLYLFNTIPLRILYEDYAVQFSTRQNPVLSGTISDSNTSLLLKTKRTKSLVFLDFYFFGKLDDTHRFF